MEPNLDVSSAVMDVFAAAFMFAGAALVVHIIARFNLRTYDRSNVDELGGLRYTYGVLISTMVINAVYFVALGIVTKEWLTLLLGFAMVALTTWDIRALATIKELEER